MQVCFGGGARPWRPCAWKNKCKIVTFSNVKEDVYGGLDAWCAWELEFPLVTIKKPLKLLQEEKQWRRVIQVSKWMLSKGHGRTMGTYELLLQAFDEEGRVEKQMPDLKKYSLRMRSVHPEICSTMSLPCMNVTISPRGSFRCLQIWKNWA